MLKALKPITFPTHVSQFANKTVGVDAYGW